MTSNGPPLKDLETIAAFIDRRLPPEERAEFLERLDREEALYEVFVETVRFRDEEVAEDVEGNLEDGDGAEVIAYRAGQSWSRWTLPAAAMLFVAIAAGWISWSIGRTEPTQVESLVAAGGLDLDENWFEQTWSNTRSLAPTGDESQTAFRVCVRLVDFDAAVSSGHRGDALTLSHRIEGLLGGITFSEPLQSAYKNLRRKIEQGATDAELIAGTRAAGRAAAEWLAPMGPSCELGRWAEIGRLASRSGNEGLLRGRAFQKKLAWLRASDLEPETEADLSQIGELLAASGPDLDLAGLERAFLTLIGRS